MNEIENTSMFKVRYPANVIRSASFAHGKDDVRYFLNGIFLKQNGDVVATNGHVMYRAKTNVSLPACVSIKLDGVIPVAAKICEITFIEDSDVIVVNCLDRRGNTKRSITASYVNFGKRYVDYEQAIPTGPTTDTSAIFMAPRYLAMIKKIFSNKPVKLSFYGSMMKCLLRDDYEQNDEAFVIMAMS